MQDGFCARLHGMDLGMGRVWHGKGPDIHNSPCAVQNSEKNSKLEPGHPGRVKGTYVEMGRGNTFYLKVINQAVKLLNTQTIFYGPPFCTLVL